MRPMGYRLFVNTLRYRNAETAPQLVGYILVHRAGVGLLFGDAKLRQQVEDNARFDLELSCQLVNSNFSHI